MIIITKYRNHPYHPLANTENLFYDSKNQDGLNTNPGYPGYA
ncbi:hypothetical protein STM14_0797 [Salmonella enterica subsp. enterica serovar Typhimurium str. 14028S]|uniref:Uncharacterized protein n=2 Tax=Salmonella enterica I TaxID=59201 RepID=A0A0F6AYH9_SALT1|nr:hypothetical protein SPAB_02858 [Salmonella enterica subsp. enterica serovar Paratyphi B str. SPB7]ACY87301.1 hypothetical protein STM14_0797 [Salmonella enterica subsp. enterica serovar Typhimurium str. 14028S]